MSRQGVTKEVSERRRAEAIRLRREGKTIAEIARTLRCRWNTVQRYLDGEPLPKIDSSRPGRDRTKGEKRRCASCGRTFEKTAERRMLCASCYMGKYPIE